MRAVIQRVTSASVTIDQVVAGKIGCGLLVLLGIEERDGSADIEWLASKLVNLRIFNDESGVMNFSVRDKGGDILVVSQFTLHASTRKGNRPSYIRASRPETAVPVYNQFITQLELELGRRVERGVFGAMMAVELVNDGPVTILIDTLDKE
ncbi:MAG: D-aminoacyl-tRNA deacylase [Bacteroidota bacterium]